jgi:hypothetical protein
VVVLQVGWGSIIAFLVLILWGWVVVGLWSLCVCVCAFKFVGYIDRLHICSFCACFFVAWLLFFLLQFLRLLRVSQGIEKGILRLPSEREQKRLNTHHRIFLLFSIWLEKHRIARYIYFSFLGLFGMDSICILIKTS